MCFVLVNGTPYVPNNATSDGNRVSGTTFFVEGGVPGETITELTELTENRV